MCDFFAFVLRMKAPLLVTFGIIVVSTVDVVNKIFPKSGCAYNWVFR